MRKKRLLIITKFFFPHPSVGAVRMTQWSRFLPEFDWQPTVLCQYHGHLATRELIDEKLHPEVSVEYFNHQNENARSLTLTEKERFYIWKTRLAKSAIGHWAVPDIQIKFWRAARRKTREVIERVQPDVILTTTPPQAIHDLGLWASGEFSIPWVADFRDPYLIFDRTRLRITDKLRWSAHKRYERAIYDRASLVTHATAIHARWARMNYPESREKIATVLNGFPPELVDGSIKPARALGNRTSIRAVGFVGYEETKILAEGMKVLIDDGIDLELRVVGNLSPQVRSLGELLGERFVALMSMPHTEALTQIAGADVLVCMANRARAPLIGLSTKVFEYVATGKPVILINPKPPDRQFVRRLPGVRMLYAPKLEEMVEALRWALTPAAQPSTEQVASFRAAYDRRVQAAQIARHLDSLTGQSAEAREAAASTNDSSVNGAGSSVGELETADQVLK